MIGPFNSHVIFDGDGGSTEHKVGESGHCLLTPPPFNPGDTLRSFLCPAEGLSPTLLCAALPLSFHWERMFDIQAIPSSILDVSFHGSASHRSAPRLLTLIPPLFVLAAAPVFLTWQKEARAASLAHREEVTSVILWPVRHPAEAPGQGPGVVSFMFLFL